MYLDMIVRLVKDWPEAPPQVRALAARFYIGADTQADLERQSRPLVGWEGAAPISPRQAAFIIESKDRYVS